MKDRNFLSTMGVFVNDNTPVDRDVIGMRKTMTKTQVAMNHVIINPPKMDSIVFSMLGGEYELLTRDNNVAIIHEGNVMTVNEAIDSMNSTMVANMAMIGEFVRVVSGLMNEDDE